MPWTGDPVWLADVLRAEGLTVVEYPGWKDRGHGDFGNIWGVIAHHTGNNPPGNNPGYIANHPSLGLCSQLHLSRDGVFTVCGVGVAWHAGAGAYPGLPTNDANERTIGIEAENNGTEGWGAKQYDAYVRGVAAILRKLGYDSSHAIGHKEWAGAAQGKWDPGGMDMNRFRRDIQTRLAPAPDPAPAPNAIAEMAKAAPWLGKKITVELEKPCPDGYGKFAEFENGNIYWTAETGARPIPTHLLETYAELGWETKAGALGYPTEYHSVLKDGDVQAFQRGVLYRKYGQPGFYVTGRIGERWMRGGFENGPLGWPTSNEIPNGDGSIRQEFEHGRIVWSPDGTVAMQPVDGADTLVPDKH